MKNWQAYERLVSLLMSDKYNDDQFTVIPNAKITGLISGVKRQIDVLVEYRYSDDLSRRIAIDAKLRKSPLDIKELEQFEGLLKDIEASKGYLICPNGATKAAYVRSQDLIDIEILENPDELDLSAWDICLNPDCSDGLVLWDASPGILPCGSDSVIAVNCTGKCDRCAKFHVWCWDCGNRVFLQDEEEWQCSCEGPWFWLTSIESEDYTTSSGIKTVSAYYLILVFKNGQYQVVDRRPS